MNASRADTDDTGLGPGIAHREFDTGETVERSPHLLGGPAGVQEDLFHVSSRQSSMQALLDEANQVRT